MNTICLMGRIGTDLELRHTPNGVEVLSFTLAVRRDKENTDWIDCVAWRKTAETLNSYCKKGSRIALVGSMQTRSYEDKEGKKRKAYEVLVDRVYFCESGKQEDKKPEPQGEFVPVGDDDELPF